jgi:putative MATE family efflux protein
MRKPRARFKRAASGLCYPAARVKGELTHGPELARLIAFGLPLVLGSVAHSLFNLVDVWLVGRYAPQVGEGGIGREAALAAIHAASVLNFLPMLVANGIAVATIATLSRSVGAGDEKRVGDVVGRSLLIALAVGAVAGVIAGATSRLQIEALRIGEEAFEASVRCLEITSYGSVTMFALLQVTAIERAAGRSMPSLALLTGANLLNVGLAVLLVPRFGAQGAAWATVLSRGAFASLGILWLYGRTPALRRSPGPLAPLLRDARAIFRLGIPAALQIFSRALSVLYVTRLLAPAAGASPEAMHESTDMTAAYGVALRLEMIAMFACAGWGTAAAAAVGQNLGAGQSARAVRMGWIGALVAGASMIVLGAAFYLLAPRLFPFFVDEEHASRLESIVRSGTGYFRVLAFAYAFVGVGIVLAEAANGAGATRVSFVVDFLVYVAGLSVLATILRNAYGYPGIWIALLAAHGIAASVYAGLFGRIVRAHAHA